MPELINKRMNILLLVEILGNRFAVHKSLDELESETIFPATTR